MFVSIKNISICYPLEVVGCVSVQNIFINPSMGVDRTRFNHYIYYTYHYVIIIYIIILVYCTTENICKIN